MKTKPYEPRHAEPSGAPEPPSDGLVHEEFSAAPVHVVIERTHDGALIRIKGHDQILAEFTGSNAVTNAKAAMNHVQRAIVKYAYQAAYVYAEMIQREEERVRTEAQLRSLESSIAKLSDELRTLTEY